jgi:hypothetical protein
MPRWFAAAAVLAAAVLVMPGRLSAAASCATPGYTYAGLQSLTSASGIAADLTTLDTPVVRNGHVAGWVGVGSVGEGPNGTNEWIQVGLNSLTGRDNNLYYEVAQPAGPIQYVQIAADMPLGESRRIAVLEMEGRPDFWRVWVDGKAVSPPVYLASSHGNLTPIATAESWGGGVPVCNRFAYQFDRVMLAGAPGGSWKRLDKAYVIQNPGYRVRRRQAGFLATVARAPGS